MYKRYTTLKAYRGKYGEENWVDLYYAAAIYAGAVLFLTLFSIPYRIGKQLRPVSAHRATAALVINSAFLAAVVELASYSFNHDHHPTVRAYILVASVVLGIDVLQWSVKAVSLVGKTRGVPKSGRASREALHVFLMIGIVALLASF